MGRIFEMWMACHTQQEIAEAVKVPRETVRDLEKGFGDFGSLADSAKPADHHLSDFEVSQK